MGSEVSDVDKSKAAELMTQTKEFRQTVEQSTVSQIYAGTRSIPKKRALVLELKLIDGNPLVNQ